MADVTARPPTERLALCKELLVLRERIDGAPDDKKTKAAVLLGRRVRAIRSVLLGRPGSGVADDILTPGGLDRQLHAAIEAAKSGPQHQKVATALYVRGIRETMAVIRRAEAGLGGDAGGDLERSSIVEFADGTLGLPGHNPHLSDPVIDAMIERGRFSDDMKGSLAALKELESRAKEERDQMVAGYNERLRKIKAEYEAGHEARSALQRLAEREAAWNALQKFWNENYVPLDKEMRDKYAASFEAEKKARQAIGNEMIGRVLDSSTVTEDAARQWADAQEVTKTAVARLRKIGYPLDKLRSDMAEFYRFTGGRVFSVRIDSNGSRRANATHIEAHGKVGTINLDGNFGRRTLWHELAHHMEADPVAKAAAGRYIRRRSLDDGKVYRLRSMTGNSGYRSDEVAYKAGFFEPYVGKVYRDGLTEVFAMGVETFSDPELLAQRAAKDPETLEFIAGFVSEPMSELARAHMGLRQIVTDLNGDLNAANEDQAAQIIRELAAKAELIPDEDRSWVGDNWLRQASTRDMVQIGRFGADYWLYAGKVRSQRGRMVKGLKLFRPTTDYGRDGIQSWTFETTDTDVVKAAMALKWAGIDIAPYRMTDADWLMKNARHA